MLQESESSAFQFQPVWGLHFLWSVCNHPPPQGGGLILQKNSKILRIFREEPSGPIPKAVLLFLGCYSLISLSSPFSD